MNDVIWALCHYERSWWSSVILSSLNSLQAISLKVQKLWIPSKILSKSAFSFSLMNPTNGFQFPNLTCQIFSSILSSIPLFSVKFPWIPLFIFKSSSFLFFQICVCWLNLSPLLNSCCYEWETATFSLFPPSAFPLVFFEWGLFCCFNFGLC